MKKIVVFLALIFPMLLSAQNVAINTDGSLPDNNAILDIKSNSKGILIPRLTTAERIGIVSAVPGLTVFDSETFSYWLYRGELNGGWSELLSTFDKHWERTGTNIFNNNPGNIGIGTNSPAVKLAINGINPTIGMYNSGLAVGSIQADGFDIKIGTHPDNPVGDIVFQPKGIDKIWVTENGRLGLNTSTPSSLLTINGSNLNPARIQLAHDNINKSYIANNLDDLLIGTENGNTTGDIKFQTKGSTRMTIDPIGQVGIGTSPTSALTINSTANTTLKLQKDFADLGFIKVESNNMILGPSNSVGYLKINTNGIDRMQISNQGAVSIGTNSGSSTFVTVGENANGRSGISFRGINDEYRGALYYSSTGGVLEGLGGDLFIKAGGIGIKLFEDGNFAMGGITKATGYRLSVHGKAIATDFTTSFINNWPDYVFDDEYKLKPLAEVKKFIEENKHLPNIPPAAEIEKSGVQLGDMSKRLMEKVEELTLYIIQLDEKSNQLQKQIDELKKGKN